MNLLAHLHLSGSRPVNVAAGNLLADYLRRLKAKPLDAGFAEGIRLHRSIDAFTDAHPATRAARAGLPPPWRRLGGILVDVAFDYFLSNDWPRYSPVPLREHVAEQLAAIQRYLQDYDTPLGPLVNRAIAEEWLLAYGTFDGLRLTFERVSSRSPVARKLLGAEKVIQSHLPLFRTAYEDFYPRLLDRFGDSG